jgi:aryl-alcohol dehydrogenase-like predicted oxidoreductase
MTWGRQNTEADAHAQLSYALEERGINFIDTAGTRARAGTRTHAWRADNNSHTASVALRTRL